MHLRYVDTHLPGTVNQKLYVVLFFFLSFLKSKTRADDYRIQIFFHPFSFVMRSRRGPTLFAYTALWRSRPVSTKHNEATTFLPPLSPCWLGVVRGAMDIGVNIPCLNVFLLLDGETRRSVDRWGC